MGLSLKKHFWDWFQRNSETYLKLTTLSKKEYRYWVNELQAHVRLCGRSLTVILYWPKNGAMPQIIISAKGRTDYFHLVEKLVSKAPRIPGWEVIGFNPPRPIDFYIQAQYGHTGIDPHHLWFMPCLSGCDDQPAICVFADRYEVPDWQFEEAVYAVVENLLGERSASLDLKWITVERLVDVAEDQRPALMWLQELPTYLERRKFSSLCIDGQGALKGVNDL